MELTKLVVRNFRLLKDVNIDLEGDLSLIIGKNNCGKTSLLLVLEKFLGGKSSSVFSFDDFNGDYKDYLVQTLTKKLDYSKSAISLRVFIKYDEEDDLSSIGNNVIMDLDPQNNVVVLGFDYQLLEKDFLRLDADFSEFQRKRAEGGKKEKSANDFLRENHSNYFGVVRKSIKFDVEEGIPDEDDFVDLDKEKVKLDKVINFKWISARRNVSNKDSDRSLSLLSAKIYKKLEANNSNPEVLEEFKDTLGDTDEQLNEVYGKIFGDVISDIKKFGGARPDDSVIKVVSSLQQRDLLEENTTVMYGVGDSHSLPENYNGLGYLNLISMIFELKLKLHEFKGDEGDKPASINLLFIEEPEAHTHPQLQRIFIKNIKTLLYSDPIWKSSSRLQTLLSTHSSYIVSESDFEDIKYFKKDERGVVSKNLKDLKSHYENTPAYTFLRQYLTIHRSELFFADKAIFIEGDTERILLPAMMKKIDQRDRLAELQSGEVVSIPLLSQNISMIEVGAYSHIFDRFLDFIGVKSVIVTDIDSARMVDKIKDGEPVVDDNGEVEKKISKCKVVDGEFTTNASLKYFYKKDALEEYAGIAFEEKILRMPNTVGEWTKDPGGKLVCAYQVVEINAQGSEYHARSFEDAFFHINKDFMKSQAYDENEKFIGGESFPSLTQRDLKRFVKDEIDSYEFAESAISSKPSFAMEILLNSMRRIDTVASRTDGRNVDVVIDFYNWNTPKYIEEALEWLKKD